MISTVTTSTITTVTAIAAMGLATTISIAAVVALIAFLITRELSGASQSTPAQMTARFLSVSIVPLALVFAVTLAVRIAEMLR